MLDLEGVAHHELRGQMEIANGVMNKKANVCFVFCLHPSAVSCWRVNALQILPSVHCVPASPLVKRLVQVAAAGWCRMTVLTGADGSGRWCGWYRWMRQVVSRMLWWLMDGLGRMVLHYAGV